ncbi:MAG: DUF1460 domain-containing protein [Desulfuromusa sp.]
MIKFTNLILKLVFFFILPLFLTSCSTLGHRPIDLGDWNRTKLEYLQNSAKDISDPGQKITLISAAFLETPYLADTLIGNAETAETFVLRLDGVDCFTLLDYVEALRRSSTFDEFKKILRHIRYREGQVNFLNRNHFFSEWGHGDSSQLQDVTALVGRVDIRRVEKQLNQKGDGTFYLPGYPVRKREVTYIPPEAIDKSMLSRLRSGDYVGIYSPLPGLDVSHTGIIIIKSGKTLLRHASSRELLRKVIDDELLPYLGREKGLIVYRTIGTD